MPTVEAMRNSDWRKRRSDDDDSTVNSEVVGVPCPWQCTGRCGEDAATYTHDQFTSETSSQPRPLPSIEATQRNLKSIQRNCRVVGIRPVKALDQIAYFLDVEPLSNANQGSDTGNSESQSPGEILGILRQLQLSKRAGGAVSNECLDEQLMMAIPSEVPLTVPQHFKAHNPIHSRKDGELSQSSQQARDQSLPSVIKTGLVYSKGNQHDEGVTRDNKVRSNVKVLKGGKRRAESQIPQTNTPSDKAAGFRKVLQMLNKGQKECIATASGTKGVPDHVPQVRSFYAQSAIRRRGEASTDSGYASSFSCKPDTASNSDKVSLNHAIENLKPNMFNPKAREFLSRQSEDDADRSFAFLQNLPRVHPGGDLQGSRDGLTQAMTLEQLEIRHLQAIAGKTGLVPLNPCNGMPMPWGNDAAAPSYLPNVLLPVMPRLATSLAPDHIANGGMGPGFWPAPRIAPAGYLAGRWPFEPFNELAGSFRNSQPFTPMYNPHCPITAPYLAPRPSFAPWASNPGKVSKPQRPDAGNQQAYEAWIEWRKANEPGYATECKNRQRRRAERIRQNVDDVEKPEKATEVS